MGFHRTLWVQPTETASEAKLKIMVIAVRFQWLTHAVEALKTSLSEK